MFDGSHPPTMGTRVSPSVIRTLHTLPIDVSVTAVGDAWTLVPIFFGSRAFGYWIFASTFTVACHPRAFGGMRTDFGAIAARAPLAPRLPPSACPVGLGSSA